MVVVDFSMFSDIVDGYVTKILWLSSDYCHLLHIGQRHAFESRVLAVTKPNHAL